MNEQTQKTPMLLTGLTWLSVIVFLVSMYMGLVYAPTEAIMGAVQRVFYYHVATNWVGAVAFAVTVVTGIIYLINRGRIWDRISLASVEVGLIFLIVGTVTGSIWGRPVWNTWWTWDPRLTTATVTILLYVAYLMLRQSIEDPNRRATFAAVYGIVAFISVPITFLSIRIWRTIHPVVIGSGDPSAEGSFNMTPEMTQTLLFAIVAFTVMYVALAWHRVRLETLSEETAERKMQAMNA